jgi:hypothetical protein
MTIYRNKYTLEFDDVIEGEFNVYKLEINKKVSETTTNNVTVGAINNSGETINQFDPVRVVSGEVVKSKASVSSSMPSTGIATVAIASGGTTPNGILVSGVLEGIPSQVIGYDYYVGINGGTTNTAPTGTNIVQRIAVQVANNSAALLDNQVTLTGTNSPIQLNYNLVDDDILSPFRASYLDISFYKESLSDDFSELFEAENDSFKVYLHKGTDLFWQGWIGTQLFSEPFASPPYPISIRAYDGLHLLKNIPYFDDTEVFQATSNLFNDRFGYHNIVDVVEKCIYNTGVLNNVFYCINIQNSESVTSSLFFPVRSRVHHQTFLKGESNSMNMEEVLQMILKSLGATIYQRDGNWCIIRISDFTLKITPSILKRDTWISDSTTETNYITTNQSTGSVSKVSNNIDFVQIDGYSTMTLQYPLKEVTIEQEFDHDMVTKTTIDSVKDLGADDPSGLYLFDEWEPLGANIQEAVVLRSNEINVSESANLPKSFIEADAQAQSLQMNYCDSSLSYPVSHDCIIDSSTIKGLKAQVRARPLGSSLSDNQAIRLMFSPELNYDEGSTVIQKGFGVSQNIYNGMINGSIFRVSNAMAEAANFSSFLISMTALTTSTYAGTFIIKVKRNRVDFFNSGVINTADLDSNGKVFFGYDRYFFTRDDFTVSANDFTVEFELDSGDVYPIMFQWYYRFGSSTVGTIPLIDGFYSSTNTVTARANGNTYASTTVVVDNNLAGDIEVGDIVTGEDIVGDVTVSSLTDQNNLVLSSAQTLVNNRTLWFTKSRADTNNFKNSDILGTPLEGGNTTGIGAEVLNSVEGVANLFQKDWNCQVGEIWNPFTMKSNILNDWTEYSITSNTDWDSTISNLKVYMRLFAAAEVYGTLGIATSPPFINTYDVSYTDIRLLPLVTDSIIVPKKQEYILTQSGNFSSKLKKEVQIGSGLFNTGSKRYITFTSESGSTAKKSWDTFRDTRGTSVGQGVENATIQHLLCACYMELYRTSVRRLDGIHYGNYKYGDKLMPIVNGSVETLNGSQGKFFPMNVVMDLRMARTSFSGDDLMDNTGADWQSTLTKSIKWIGDNGITETETLT